MATKNKNPKGDKKCKTPKGTKKCKTPVKKLLKGKKAKSKAKPPMKPVAMAPKGAMPPMKGGMPMKVM